MLTVGIIYIPLCFYFIAEPPPHRTDRGAIYIPLCFYFIDRRTGGDRRGAGFTFHYASTLSRPPFPLLFSSIQVYFLSTPLSSYLSSQKSSSSHFTKFKFSLIFQALSISQQFSSISGRQSQEITCLIIIHSPELLRYPLLISAFKYD